MSKQITIEKEVYKRLEKPKWMDLWKILDIVSLVPTFYQLFVNKNASTADIGLSACISVILLLLIEYLIAYFKFNKFYKAYSIKFEKLIDEITEDKHLLEHTKEMDKKIKDLEDNSLNYEIVDEW